MTLAGIGAVQLMAAMSPGPAFLIVTRISVAQPRRVALCAAAGVVAGTLFWAVAATLGLHLVLERATWLYGLLKFCGGCFLLWLGWTAWRHAENGVGEGAAATVRMAGWQAWRMGFGTNMANPKVVVFFGSIFVALFTPEMPGWVRIAALAIVAVNESLWYGLLAVLFSSRAAQVGYERVRRWIDRLAGALMIGFGVRLILAGVGRM